MKVSDSYDAWARSYDSMDNKTRDLEAEVLRSMFLNPHYGNILELGCGTGKNTDWLSQKADYVTALDFSSEMIARANARITSKNVTFVQTDINDEWPVKPGWANLITCSLVLEHIRDLHSIFSQGARSLKRKGKLYICELHPYKQYTGSQARFETEAGMVRPQVFLHHISDYLRAAERDGFKLLDLDEHFDEGRNEGTPRLVSIVFERQ